MRSFPTRLWAIALAAALVLLTIDSAERLYMMRAITALDAFGVAHPPRDAASPTGYALGQRDLVLPGSGMDGYHWIMQTQQMLAAGEARVRSVAYDNAPAGREVHWGAPLHWWLAALAFGYHIASGEPLGIAVETVAPLANPLLLAFLLLGLTPLVAKRLGAAAAAALAGGLVAVYPIAEAFVVSGPDHHGLALGCGLMATLFLVLGGGGWIRDGGRSERGWIPDLRGARRWFMASAVAGAAGVWISAATILPLIAGLGLGAVVAGVTTRAGKSEPGLRPAPDLWRWWGLTGGAAMVLFYAVEYLPSDFAWRLEVIHPLYAFAWAGGGEIVAQVVAWRQGGPARGRTGSRVVLVAAIVAVLAPAVVIAVGGHAVFAVLDPMVSSVPLAEFFALPHVFQKLTWVESIVGFTLLPLVALPAAIVWGRGRVDEPARARLALVGVAGILMLLLGWRQIRWMGMASGVWLVALVVLVAVVPAAPGRGSRSRWRKWLAVAFGLAVFVPYPAWVMKFGIDELRDAAGVSPKDMELVALRDVARELRTRLGPDASDIVLAGPDVTTQLCYHGGLRGVGTVYWENAAGVAAAAEILAAPDEATARARIEARRITHLVVVSWDPFPREAGRLLALVHEPSGAAFARSLQDVRQAPRWLRPVFLPVPEHEYLRDTYVRVYEFAPEQTAAEAAIAQGWYLMAAGRPADALGPLRQAFGAAPENLAVLVALGHAQLALGDEAGLGRTLAGLGSRRDEAARLAAVDRVRLALLLATGGNAVEAARELRAVLATVTPEQLRRFDVFALVDLVTLAGQFGLADGEPAAVAEAIRLIPPVVRKRADLAPPP